MLYACYKGRLITNFRRIVQLTSHRNAPTYNQIMGLNNSLHETHGEVPPSLRMRPLIPSFTEHPSIVLNRLYIELVFLTSCCVLHRRFLTYDRLNPAFEYSRKCCTDAALRMLGHHIELHAACQPGAQFGDEKTMISSLTLHDFLIAAMIICVDLYESRNRITASRLDSDDQTLKYDTLIKSHRVWLSRKATSRDARKACNIVAFILSKISRPSFNNATTQQNKGIQDKATVIEMHSSPQESNEDQHRVQSEQIGQTWSSGPYDPWSTMIDGSTDLDWVSRMRQNFQLRKLTYPQGLIDQNMLSGIDIDNAFVDWQFLDSIEPPVES